MACDKHRRAMFALMARQMSQLGTSVNGDDFNKVYEAGRNQTTTMPMDEAKRRTVAMMKMFDTAGLPRPVHASRNSKKRQMDDEGKLLPRRGATWYGFAAVHQKWEQAVNQHPNGKAVMDAALRTFAASRNGSNGNGTSPEAGLGTWKCQTCGQFGNQGNHTCPTPRDDHAVQQMLAAIDTPTWNRINQEAHEAQGQVLGSILHTHPSLFAYQQGALWLRESALTPRQRDSIRTTAQVRLRQNQTRYTVSTGTGVFSGQWVVTDTQKGTIVGGGHLSESSAQEYASTIAIENAVAFARQEHDKLQRDATRLIQQLADPSASLSRTTRAKLEDIAEHTPYGDPIRDLLAARDIAQYAAQVLAKVGVSQISATRSAMAKALVRYIPRCTSCGRFLSTQEPICQNSRCVKQGVQQGDPVAWPPAGFTFKHSRVNPKSDGIGAYDKNSSPITANEVTYDDSDFTFDTDTHDDAHRDANVSTGTVGNGDSEGVGTAVPDHSRDAQSAESVGDENQQLRPDRPRSVPPSGRARKKSSGRTGTRTNAVEGGDAVTFVPAIDSLGETHVAPFVQVAAQSAATDTLLAVANGAKPDKATRTELRDFYSAAQRLEGLPTPLQDQMARYYGAVVAVVENPQSEAHITDFQKHAQAFARLIAQTANISMCERCGKYAKEPHVCTSTGTTTQDDPPATPDIVDLPHPTFDAPPISASSPPTSTFATTLQEAATNRALIQVANNTSNPHDRSDANDDLAAVHVQVMLNSALGNVIAPDIRAAAEAYNASALAYDVTASDEAATQLSEAQTHLASVIAETAGVQRCPDCGQFMADDHVCSPSVKSETGSVVATATHPLATGDTFLVLPEDMDGATEIQDVPEELAYRDSVQPAQQAWIADMISESLPALLAVVNGTATDDDYETADGLMATVSLLVGTGESGDMPDHDQWLTTFDTYNTGALEYQLGDTDIQELQIAQRAFAQTLLETAAVAQCPDCAQYFTGEHHCSSTTATATIQETTPIVVQETPDTSLSSATTESADAPPSVDGTELTATPDSPHTDVNELVQVANGTVVNPGAVTKSAEALRILYAPEEVQGVLATYEATPDDATTQQQVVSFLLDKLGVERCSDCGQFKGQDHVCPPAATTDPQSGVSESSPLDSSATPVIAPPATPRPRKPRGKANRSTPTPAVTDPSTPSADIPTPVATIESDDSTTGGEDTPTPPVSVVTESDTAGALPDSPADAEISPEPTVEAIAPDIAADVVETPDEPEATAAEANDDFAFGDEELVVEEARPKKVKAVAQVREVEMDMGDMSISVLAGSTPESQYEGYARNTIDTEIYLPAYSSPYRLDLSRYRYGGVISPQNLKSLAEMLIGLNDIASPKQVNWGIPFANFASSLTNQPLTMVTVNDARPAHLLVRSDKQRATLYHLDNESGYLHREPGRGALVKEAMQAVTPNLTFVENYNRVPYESADILQYNTGEPLSATPMVDRHYRNIVAGLDTVKAGGLVVVTTSPTKERTQRLPQSLGQLLADRDDLELVMTTQVSDGRLATEGSVFVLRKLPPNTPKDGEPPVTIDFNNESTPLRLQVNRNALTNGLTHLAATQPLRTEQPRCPICKAWVSEDGDCRNPKCASHDTRTMPLRQMATTFALYVSATAQGDQDTSEAYRAALVEQYQDFTAQYGLLNAVANRTLITSLNGTESVLFLEQYNQDNRQWEAANLAQLDEGNWTLESAVESLEDKGLALNIHALAAMLGDDPEEVEQRLLDNRLAFFEPNKGLVFANEYLSGNVREKLQDAQKWAEVDPRFIPNVEALLRVVPPTIPITDLSIPLGTMWMSPTAYVEFYQQRIGADVKDLDYLGPLGWRGRGDDTKNSRWFIRGYESSWRIFMAAMNGKYPVVYKTVPVLDDKNNLVYKTDKQGAILLDEKGVPIPETKRIVDRKATRQARQIVDDMRSEFNGWLQAHPTFGILAEAEYNRRFNSDVPRYHPSTKTAIETFLKTDSPFYDHQREGVRRLASGGRQAINIVAGGGKTRIAQAALVALQHQGNVGIPTHVVLNATLEDYVRSFNALTANAPQRLLVIRTEDINSTEKQQTLVAKIVAGQYDQIIITHEAFADIDMDRDALLPLLEAERRVYDDTVRSIRMSYLTTEQKLKRVRSVRRRWQQYASKIVNSVNPSGAAIEGIDTEIEDPDIRELEDEVDAERVKNSKEPKYKPLREAAQRKKEEEEEAARLNPEGSGTKKRKKRQRSGIGREVRPFNWRTLVNIGVSGMVVDESHQYKNGPMTSRIMGFSQEGSGRAADMWAKNAYMQRVNGGRNFAMMTGTPFSNDLIPEAFWMVKNIAPEELTKRGIYTLDDFISTFAEVTVVRTPTIDGQRFKEELRIERIKNAPELIGILNRIGIWELDDSKLGLTLPSLKGGSPTIIRCEPSDVLRAEFEAFARTVERGERRPDGSYERIHPFVLGDRLRKLALLGTRATDSTRDDPSNKVNHVVREVAQRYHNPRIENSTQAVYCDLSVPNNEGRYSVYDEMVEKLVAAGIPRKDIAIGHDYNTETGRIDLQDKMNRGELRVLIASRRMFGTGVNLQQRAEAVHQMDMPWTPTELEQSNRRVHRQGNLNSEIEALYYVTPPVDTFMAEKVRRKSALNEEVLKAQKTGQRVVEAPSEVQLTYSQLRAAATGNPDFMRLETLRGELAELQAHTDRTRSRRANLKRRQADLESRRDYAQNRSNLDVTQAQADLYDRLPRPKGSDRPSIRTVLPALDDNGNPVITTDGKPVFREYDKPTKQLDMAFQRMVTGLQKEVRGSIRVYFPQDYVDEHKPAKPYVDLHFIHRMEDLKRYGDRGYSAKLSLRVKNPYDQTVMNFNSSGEFNPQHVMGALLEAKKSMDTRMADIAEYEKSLAEVQAELTSLGDETVMSDRMMELKSEVESLARLLQVSLDEGYDEDTESLLDDITESLEDEGDDDE